MQSPFIKLALPMLCTCSVLVGCTASSEVRPSPQVPPTPSEVANVQTRLIPDVYDRDFERADATINPALIGEEEHEDQARTSKDSPKAPNPRAFQSLPENVLSAGITPSSNGAM